MADLSTHDCEKVAGTALFSGHNQDGDLWTCPVCGRDWEYVEDEAEGGHWSSDFGLSEIDWEEDDTDA